MKDNQILELINNPKTKDRGFSELVNKHKERVYWQIRRMVLNHEDADDLTQEVFLKVYLSIDAFKMESSINTWVYRIAVNHTLNFLDKQKRKSVLRFRTLESFMLDNLRTDQYFDSDELEFKLQKALLSLPKKQRIVFNLRYYEDMPFNEMSEILKTSEGALKASYHFAYNKVQEYLLGDKGVNFEMVN